MRSLSLRRLALISCALLSACNSSSDTASGGGGSAASGTLRVSLTDAPSVAYKAVYITPLRLRLHSSSTAADADAGWQEIEVTPAGRINLLDLQNGLLRQLGEVTLPAGTYSQIRLVLSDTPRANSVVMDSDPSETEIELATPSAQSSGLKLIHSFEVRSNDLVELVLDFDASRSVVRAGASGRYLLKPVISATVVSVAGQIAGIVDASSTSPTLVSAQIPASDTGGTPVVVRSTLSTDGNYRLSPLPAGPYALSFSRAVYATHIVTSLAVSAGQTLTLPAITLGVSADSTLSGNVSDAVSPPAVPEGARVSALQRVTTGVVIEAGLDLADSDTGSYTLSLPRAVPRVAPYASGPLVFTDGLDAGRYTARASATGFASQAWSADLSAGNLTHDFVLIVP